MAKFLVKGSVLKADIIEISGEITEKYIASLKEKFNERTTISKEKNIILLCKNIKRVDSSGASLLAEISSEAKKNNRRVFLVHCPSSVKILINFMGVEHLCEFYSSEEEVCEKLGISHQDFLFSATGRALKRQLVLVDTLQNKKFTIQYNQSMNVAGMIAFIKKKFLHFKNISICLEIDNVKLPKATTVEAIFNKYNYSQSNKIYIKEDNSKNNNEFEEKFNTAFDEEFEENITEKIPDDGYADFGASLINKYGNDRRLIGEGTVVDDVATPEDILQGQVEIKDDLLCSEEVTIEIAGTLPRILEQAVTRIKQVEKTLEFILELSRSFSANKDFKEILKNLMTVIYNFENYGYGIIFLYDRKMGKLVTQCIRNNEEDSFQKTMISKQIIESTEEQRSLVIATHEKSSRMHISIPILSGKQLLGIIYLIGIPDRKYSKEKLLMLSTITNYGALAIENAILIKELDSVMAGE